MERSWESMRALFPLLALLFPVVGVGQEGVPAPFPEDRYAPMKAKTPFGLATPKVVKEETPSFAQNLFVSGLAKLGDDALVTLTTPDKKSYTVKPGENTPEGISVVSVDWSAELGKSKVSVKKGNEFATIGFNEMVIKAPISVTAVPQPGGPQPPRLPVGPQVRPPGAPGVPAAGGTQTRRRPIIRRPSR